MEIKRSKELLTILIVCIAMVFPVSLVEAQAGSGCGKCCEGVPTITLRTPDKGISHHGCSDNITIGIRDMARFHGSLGPGVALGYRACQIALSQLYPGDIPLRGDQFVVSGSVKACPTDSISFITGARYGKGSDGAFNGNLAFDKSIGDFCFIFARMSDGKAIKLINKFKFPKGFKEVKAKLKDKGTSPEEKKKCFEKFRSLSLDILAAPEKDVFKIVTLTNFSWKDYKEKYLK